jgi:heparin binding hemagglutinin HbhA
MLDGVRKFMRERFDRLSSSSPEDIARTLAQRGQARKQQAGRIARDVVEWSRKNRERIAGVVRREVRQQIAKLGVATKEEVSSLRRRVRDLEGEAPAKKAAAKKPASRKATTKRAASKRSAPRKAAARKTSPPARRA